MKITLPPEVLARCNVRARELAASSPAVLIEALLRSDQASPVPGLADLVKEVEADMDGARSERGRASMARNRRGRNTST